jgi:hypothetical protein
MRLRSRDARHQTRLPVLLARPQRLYASGYCPLQPLPGPGEISNGVEFGGGVLARPCIPILPTVVEEQLTRHYESRIHVLVLSAYGLVVLGPAHLADLSSL